MVTKASVLVARTLANDCQFVKQYSLFYTMSVCYIRVFGKGTWSQYLIFSVLSHNVSVYVGAA